MMKTKIILIIFFSAILFNLPAQSNDDVLAFVGGIKISKEEFLTRYEFTPQLMKENRNIKDELKKEFLYSIIAEKLLALYGQSISIDTSEIVKYSLKTFEEIFVRDELYKKFIVERAKTKADSILDFYLLNAATLDLIYIKSKEKKEIDNIYKLLNKNVPFETLYNELSDQPKDTLVVNINQFDDYTEHEIFTLKKDSISKPLFIGNEYYIFKVLRRRNQFIEKPEGWEKEYDIFEKLAKSKAENEYYQEFMRNFFNDGSYKANGKLLQAFSSEVYQIFLKKKIETDLPQKFILEVNDIADINTKLGSGILNAPYIILNNGTVPLKDFINYLRFENVSFDTLNYQKVLDILNKKTKKYIEHKILSSEGYKLKLNESPNVKKNMKLWRENYLYQLAMSTFIDSANVSDVEINSYYNELHSGKLRIKEVNIEEVVTDSIEVAEIVLKELEKGIDIKNLALKYSIKNDVKNNHGESGFFPVSSRGEIGKIADNMKIGEIYGPLKIPEEGYIIFKLIGIKTDSVKDSTSFAQLRKELSRELGYLKMKKSLDRFIAHLANKYNVSIDNDLLKAIRVTNINSIIYNYLGFGGRMLAIPLIAPNYDWFQEWQKIRENL